MVLWQAFREGLSRPIAFRGRMARGTFWLFVLGITLCLGGLLVLAVSLTEPRTMVFIQTHADGLRLDEPVVQTRQIYPIGIPATLFALAFALPMLSASWRRLQDTGLSGAIVLLVPAALLLGSSQGAFIALLLFGAAKLLLVALLIRPGQTGPNRFGPNPAQVLP